MIRRLFDLLSTAFKLKVMNFSSKAILVIPSLLCLVRVSCAQTTISIGPQIGINTSRVSYDRYSQQVYQNGSLNINQRAGINAGLTATLTKGHFSLQPAVQFMAKGFVLKETTLATDQVGTTYSSYNERYRFNYLSIPVNFAYSLKVKGNGIQFFGGGYLGILLGGKIEYDNSFQTQANSFTYSAEGKVRPNNQNDMTGNDFNANRFDVGLQGGIGYKFSSILVQGYYQIGFLDASSHDSKSLVSIPKIKNRSLGINISYLFLSK